MPLSPQLAYIVGLIYPQIRTYTHKGTEYLLGSISYGNAQIPVSENDINNHFLEVYRFLKSIDVKIVANKNEEFGLINRNKGFTILLIDDTNDNGREILLNITSKIHQCENTEIKKFLIRGCFDGRGSYDGGTMFAIDTDRIIPDNEERDMSNFPGEIIWEGFDLVKDILEEFNIGYNRNIRKDKSKKDQLRILKANFDLFLKKVGLFSIRRTNDISL